MLPRHRRRVSIIGEKEGRRPVVLMRLAAAAVVLFVIWYIVSRTLSFFDGSIGRKTATLLTVRSGESIQVSLQGGDWQRGETDLKLYAGDSVAVRGNGDALLTFFDGSRVRLEQGSEVEIKTSDMLPEGTSALELAVRTGRVWMATANEAAFTGSIVRSIATSNYVVTIPADSNVLVSSSLVNVVRASNLGVRLNFTIPSLQISDIYVGEGQYFGLNEDAKVALENGQDPYSFRDPVTQELLRDPFLISSYGIFTAPVREGNSEPSDTAGAPILEDADLIITNPKSGSQVNAKTVGVSGKVSDRVAVLRVNGQNIVLRPDRSFSVDVSMGSEKTVTITVQAEDKQGIILAKEERSVQNTFDITVEPVRIQSPAGSGETLTTSLQEVEITGEAPAGTYAVIVNDYTLQLFKPGAKTWSYLASVSLGNLVPGKNGYSVVALDADGNRSPSRSVTIQLTSGPTFSPTVDTGTGAQPPLKQNPPLKSGSLTVTGPAAGTAADVQQNEVILEGTTIAETTSISINGYTLSLYEAGKTTWNYIASTELQTMKRGKNVYRIVSRNSDGEILDVLEYTITYNP